MDTAQEIAELATAVDGLEGELDAALGKAVLGMAVFNKLERAACEYTALEHAEVVDGDGITDKMHQVKKHIGDLIERALREVFKLEGEELDEAVAGRRFSPLVPRPLQVQATRPKPLPQPEVVDIVFDGPPGPRAGRFVEVERLDGSSCRVGEWIDRGDGYWALRITVMREEST